MRKIIQIVTGQDLQCDLGHTLYALCDDEITKPRDVRDDENGRIYQMSLKDLAVKFFRGEPELLLTSYA